MAQFPQLASLEARRVFDKKYGSKNLYKIEFTPQDEMLSVTAAVNLRKLNAGATWVLDRIVAGTPLTAALQRVFAPFNRHKKLLALAYYLLISNNSALHLYPEFAAMTRLPWRRTLSSSAISRLLAGITDNDIDKFLAYLNRFTQEATANDVGKVNTYLALDSTSISTYAQALSQAAFGHNKDGEELKQINILMLVNQETGAPIYYRSFNGETPDVSTIAFLLKEHARLGINDRAVLVMDRGYGAITNLNRLLLNQVSFISNVKTSLTFCRELIADNLAKLTADDAFIAELNCSHVGLKVSWRYPTYDRTPTGRHVSEVTDLYVHLFLDHTLRHDAEAVFRKTYAAIKAKLSANTPLTPYEKNFVTKFLIRDTTSGEYSVNVTARFNYLLTKGVRILVSDCVSNAAEIWQAYYQRLRVENAFKVYKQYVGGKRFRVASDAALRGKIFITFLACAIGCMLRQRIATSRRKGFSLPYDCDTKLLAALNRIQQVIIRDGGYFTEVVGKNKTILEALDIPLPTTERYDPNELAAHDERAKNEQDEVTTVDELMAGILADSETELLE